jgi:hypothetical protein
MLNEQPVEFASESAVLRGCLLAPVAARAPLPAIVMAHGTSATVPMVAIDYAREFARRGFAVLVYDHRNFGRSGGEPRQEINPWLQCRGYRDAMTFMSGRPEVDRNRLGLWGDSYTGGQVIVLGACDPRPKAIVAQCPVFGASVPPLEPSVEVLDAIRSTLQGGDIAGGPEHTTGPLPVVSADQQASPSLLAPIQAFRWFIDYGGRPGSAWVNRVTRVIPPTAVPYSPYLCAPFVQAPTLLMVAPDDEMVHCAYGVTRSAYNLMTCEKEWHDIQDGHFGLLYHPSDRFTEAVAIQADFFTRRLEAA